MTEQAQVSTVSGPPLKNEQGYASIMDVIETASQRYAAHPAFSCMGHTLNYTELDRLSRRFASWLVNETSLEPGDRFAVLLPNVLQYPVAVFGALRAGLVVVNTNPLYTPEEIQHQFEDAGVKGALIFAHMADKLDKVIEKTQVAHVVITEIADLHPGPKRWFYNLGAKYVKRLVPKYRLPNAVRFRTTLANTGNTDRAPRRDGDDLAVLQYTGGTTGVAKGAMLSHRNLIANMLQTGQVLEGMLKEGRETIIAPLPVYHIYTFTLNCMFACKTGNHSILIPNPRDLDGFVKTLHKHSFSVFIGLNTLFAALSKRDDFKALDFSNLRMSVSGGMALSSAVAQRWEAITNCQILEGYGMTETSPVVCVNPPEDIRLGTIGRPVADTQLKVIDDAGETLDIGASGELCVKGPQVMKGYWNRPEDTAKALSADGWVKSGDIAVIAEDGFVRIVDRKKDMIIVSGFNVYPNEIEDVLMAHPDIIEAAVVGIPDEASGEAVKAFIVTKDDRLDQAKVRAWCKERLTGYKLPRHVEFRNELPKSNVGKVLRRELRDEARQKSHV
ncbi:AMP-binding protein [Phytohalomonas tamaricis]|uniref:AMP-binding protein n=1 Tax=Phytohalomonas tamaricis TaxID=2081032 RepID=UPI000D0AF96A|nr:AMP-binding protein [Phytohalomonas tamaricis]